MKQLVRSMIGHAKQQSREPGTSPGPNPAETEEMMRHIKRLEDEFDIRLRSKEATETLSSLGIYVDSLYQLAAFLSPDDPEIHRSRWRHHPHEV